jgi:hypothetical protein
MRKNTVVLLALWGVVMISAAVEAGGILQPGDPIIAFDLDIASSSSYPGGESPANALDEDSGTKYLNFGREGSGIIVSPLFGASTVQSIKFTTANDAVERDPRTWVLFGTNSPIVSLDNSDGSGEPWTVIAENNAMLPDTRFADGPVQSFTNSTSYTSYRLVFPTVKGPGGNSMQIADIRMYQSNDGSGSSILNFLDPVLAIDFASPQSSYPANEGPANAIDRDVDTKYLNFGRENSGFIVTPASGPRAVRSFRITTANDSPSRDPRVWQLFGTNDVITSVDNGTGSAENWTFIDEGLTNLLEDRFTQSDPVTVNNNSAFRSYRMVFTNIRDNTAEDADSVQFAEVQFYQSSSGISADFNDDGSYDCTDVDSLVAAIATSSGDLAFDLNGDSAITRADLTAWLAEAGSFRPAQTNGGNPFREGDANLDGVVDGSDFGIWNSNKFTSAAAWCRGDFSADGNIDGSDFGIWNSNKFTSSDGSMVPEPTMLVSGLALLTLLGVRRR